MWSDGDREIRYSGPEYELHLDGQGPQEVYVTLMQDSMKGAEAMRHSRDRLVQAAERYNTASMCW